MKIKIKRLNNDNLLEAVNETGNTIRMDSAEAGTCAGMSPMQLLLAAVGGCSCIDMIGILKKQRQEILSLDVEVEGNKIKHLEYSIWKNIKIHFILTGNIDAEKAKHAAELSIHKYCSVSKALAFSSEIEYRISINGLGI